MPKLLKNPILTPKLNWNWNIFQEDQGGNDRVLYFWHVTLIFCLNSKASHHQLQVYEYLEIQNYYQQHIFLLWREV